MQNIDQNPLAKRSTALPGIIDEIPFVLKTGEELSDIISFTELRVKREVYVPVAASRQYNIINKDIVLNPGTDSIAQIDLDKIDAYSIHVETVTSHEAVKRVTTRVVCVADTGERVLDTLVSPPSALVDPKTGLAKLKFKDQIKSKMVELANSKGPNITQVQRALVHIMKGKKIAAYHLPVRLADIGIVGD